MFWHRTHEPDAPPTHAVLRHGSQGWGGDVGHFWVDPRNERVLWAHNPDLPAIPPKLPPFPLPSISRRQRREMPGLNKISRDVLREMYRASPADTGNGASGTATSASSVATSSTLSPTANNCLAGFVITPTAITVSSVGDGTNQYTLGTPANNASGARITPYYANNVTGSGLTVTATLSGTAANAVIGVREYSGVGSIAGNRTLIDGSAAATGNTNAPSASATPQQSGSLYVVGVGDLTGGITYTAGGSVTRRLSVTSPIGLAIGEQVGSSTSVASLASAWSASGTVQWSEAVIIVRPAGTQVATAANGVNQGTAATSASFSTTPRLGEVLITAVITDTGGATTTGVTDTAGQTWAKIAAKANPSGGELSLWLLNGAASTSFTVTVTFSASTKADVIATAFPGIIATDNLVDQIASATGNGTAVSVGPTGATVIPGETAILFVGSPTGTQHGTLTPGEGESVIRNNPTTGAGSVSAQAVLLNATGTQTQTATLQNSVQWSAILITLKTGGSGGIPLSLVQSASTTVAPGGGITLPFNTAPGNMLLLGAVISTASSVTGITGTNTWAFVDKANNPSGADAELWAASNIVGGKVTPTPTISPSTGPALQLYEYSGLATTGKDVSVGTTGSGNAPSAALPQQNYLNELVVSLVGLLSTTTTQTPTSPLTMAQATQLSGGVREMTMAHYATFSPGTVPPIQTPTWGESGTVQYSLVSATFKIAGSPTYWPMAVSETSQASDAVARALHMVRGATETATTVDTAGRTYYANRSLAESASTIDAASRAAILGRGAAETSAGSDATTALAATHRLVSETATTVDAVTRILHAFRGAADHAATTDATVRAGHFGRLPSETSAAPDILHVEPLTPTSGTQGLATSTDTPTATVTSWDRQITDPE